MGSTTNLAMTADYEIEISGTLDKRWSRWFGDVKIMVTHQEPALSPSPGPPLTTFQCPVMDQARLRGVLNKIWDLNLELVSVQRLPVSRRDEVRAVREPPLLRTGACMEDSDV